MRNPEVIPRSNLDYQEKLDINPEQSRIEIAGMMKAKFYELKLSNKQKEALKNKFKNHES